MSIGNIGRSITTITETVTITLARAKTNVPDVGINLNESALVYFLFCFLLEHWIIITNHWQQKSD